MTPEQLLGMSADELDKLSDQQLNDYFQKYFPVTRPELAQKTTTQRAPSPYKVRQTSQPMLPKIVLTEKQKQALAIMASKGEDLSFLDELNKRRK